MIQVQTELLVADNTGAKRIECIKVLGGTRKKYAKLGDLIIVTVKKAIPGGVVKKGEVTIRNLPFQQDIANMAGTSRETVSRTIKLLDSGVRPKLVQHMIGMFNNGILPVIPSLGSLTIISGILYVEYSACNMGLA